MLLPTLALLFALTVTGCLAGCSELRGCIEPLRGLAQTEQMPLASLNGSDVSQIITELCQEVTTAHTCFDETKDSCQSMSAEDRVRNILLIGDYVCDPDNREMVEEIIESDCVHNETVTDTFTTELASCLTEFVRGVRQVAGQQRRGSITDYSFFCPLIDDLESCVVEKSTEVCGDAVGQFIAVVWEMAVETNMPSEVRTCFDDLEVTRRAIEHFLPALAKRHFEQLEWPTK